MADARYVIDLILRARDDSAAAFASVIGNQKALEEQTKRTEEQATRSSKALQDSNRSLHQSYKDLANTEDAQILRLKGVAEKQVELEKASRNYARTVQDVNASEAERQAALQRQTVAYKGLTEVLRDKHNLDNQSIKDHADSVKAINFEIERLEAQKKKLEELSAVEKKIARDRDAIRQQQVNADRQAGQEQKKLADQRVRDQERLTQTLRRQAQELAREDIGAKKYDDLSRSIARTRQELGRLTGDSRSALREQKKALDDAGISIDKNSRAFVNERQAIRENTKAIDVYGQAIQKAARAKADLSRATGDEKIRFQFEVDESKRAALFAAKALAGKDVHVNVDLDIGNAEAKLLAVNRQVKELKRETIGLVAAMTILKGSFSDSFANMEGSVARFDNVMRGAFTLLITFFLPQLIILAGAAGGALLALGSSAAFAGGAIGGSLVAGIGQALPVLGVLITALSRVKAVTDAVQQANLAQQQQSTRGATQARSSANAENTLTNALQAQRDAQENIALAQDRVTEARANARREVEDLILAEKRASLSVGEAQDALRDAIQSGRAGEIESRRLDLEEARIRAERTREDAKKGTSTGDPGGRIEDAQRGLKQAEEAAQRAQRATENARRSSEGAAAGTGAAAGKLQFLLSQMSAAERELFRTLTRLQVEFRQFAQNVTAPLIESFTHAAKRMEELLSDPRIIGAAKSLSQGLAREFNLFIDTFTKGRGFRQILDLSKEAVKNLRPIGTIFRNIGSIMLDVAQAAGPAFSKILGFISDLTDKWLKFTSSKEGQRELTNFFNEGVVHLKAWVDLLGSIIGLFAAIAGAGGGAKTGLDLVRGMTQAIRDFSDEIEKKGSKTHKFFTDLFKVTKDVFNALGPILSALGAELASVFGEEARSGGGIKAFTTIFTQVLIPALGQFLRIMLQVGNAVGAFVGAHPVVARMAASFAALAVSVGVLSKAWTLLFGPLKSIVNGLISAVTQIRALGIGMQVLKGVGIAGLVLAVILLLAKFHELDNIWRAIQRALRSLRGPFNELIDAFKELRKAFGLSGESGEKFMGLLAKIIRIGIVFYIESLGRVIEGLIDVLIGLIRITAGVVKIFRGFADIVIGFFTLDPKQMLKGFREIFSGLGDIFSGIGKLFEGVIETITSAFAGLPGLLKDFGIDAKNAFIDGMKGLPGALFNALAGIVDGPLALGGVLARLIDKALPDKIKLPGLPDINLPDNPLKDVGAYATGGAVPGYGGGDTVAALLEGGEHVWTKDEVRAAGGHGALFALRSFFGGGGQGREGRYAEGGAVTGSRAGNALDIAQTSLDGLLRIIDIGGDKITTSWKKTWDTFNEITKNGRQQTAQQFKAIQETVETRMQNASQIAKRRATQLKRNVLDQFEDMDKGVFRGLRYVSRNVNNALDAFGAKPTKISIDTPPGLATGGWIGTPGERGRDAVMTWLGRGEAVLNWGHQKIVNSALWNQYGTTLDGMFKSTDGYHAGGPGVGMAAGGNTGPGHSGEGFTPVWNMAKSKFGMTYFTGYDGHNMMTSSGNVSDHYMHRALDMGNGILTRGEDALNSFIKVRLGPTVKQLIWRDTDQFNGAFIGGHQDHVHYAMSDQYAFDASRMAKIISRSLRGLSIAELLAGGTTDVDHLDKIKVKGEGPLAALTKSALDKLVKFGNKYIDKIANKMLPGDFGGVHYDGPLDHLFSDPNTSISFDQAVSLARRAGFSDDVATLFGHIAQSESTLRPGIVNEIGATGLWQIYNHPDLVAKYGDMRNPWNNARAAHDLYMSGGTGPWVSSIAGWGQFAARGGFPGSIPSFDVGGVVPGAQTGSPTLIEAHAGEWVVNPAQQSKLAGLVGATAGKLKDFLGFTGGPTSFQGGGEVGGATGFTTEAERRQAGRQGRFIFPSFPLETFNQIKRAFDQAIRSLGNAATHIKENIHVRTERYLKVLQQITGENGLLDILSDRIERHTQQMATQLLRGQFVVGRRRGRNTVFRRIREGEEGFQTDDQIAEDAIANQIRTFNELNDNRKRIVRLIKSIQRQDERLRKRIAELRRGGVTDREADIIDDLQGQRVNLRAERKGLRERLEDVQQAIAEQIQAIYEARTEQIRKLATDAGRPVEIADRWGRVLSAIGFASAAAINFQVGAIKQQIAGLQTALAQAQKIGNQELVQDLQDQIGDAQVSLFEAQMELVRATAQDAIDANARYISRSGIKQRMLETLGQSTIGVQQTIIDGLKIQGETINEQIRLAYKAGNVGLAKELEDQALENQATLLDAQQALFQTIIDGINETARRSQFQTDLRSRLADVMEKGGNAIGSAQLREQILAAQRVSIEALMSSLQTVLNQQLSLPALEQNQTLIQQLTEQIDDLGVQLDENTQAVSDAANATRNAMIAAINEPAGFQTGVFGQLNSILQAVANATGGSTTGQQGDVLQQIGDVLQNQGGALRQQLFDWLGIDLAGLTGTGFVAAISNLDFEALTAGMTVDERATFEALINAIVENELAVEQNTQAVVDLGETLAPQDFASVAWQWFRQAIFTGSGGLLPQFTPPGLQEGGTVLRTGMALVHEGEWFVNPSTQPHGVPGIGDDISVTINEAGGPVDIEHLVTRLAWEQQGRRR